MQRGMRHDGVIALGVCAAVISRMFPLIRAAARSTWGSASAASRMAFTSVRVRLSVGVSRNSGC